MTTRVWIANIFLMLLILLICSMSGWSYLIDNYDHVQRISYKEWDLRREFENKQSKAAILELMKTRMVAVENDTKIGNELSSFISNTENEKSGCGKLDKIEAKTKSCTVKENRETEFYYQSQIELKLTGSINQMNHFFETITNNSEKNYSNMIWQELTITADNKSADVTLEASILFLYIYKDDEHD